MILVWLTTELRSIEVLKNKEESVRNYKKKKNKKK